MKISPTAWLQWVTATLAANAVVAALGLPLRLLWGWEEAFNSSAPVLYLAATSGLAVGALQWIVLWGRRLAGPLYVIATTLGFLPLMLVATGPTDEGFRLGIVGAGGFSLRIIVDILILLLGFGLLLGSLQALTFRSTFGEAQKAFWVLTTVIGGMCGFFLAMIVQAPAIGVGNLYGSNYRSFYFFTVVNLFEFWTCVAAAQGIVLACKRYKRDYRLLAFGR